MIELAITKQHEYYEKRLAELLKEMPDFINEYVEAKMDNRSPLTLFNYVRDYKEFLSWLMADERVKWSSLKTFPVSLLGSLPYQMHKITLNMSVEKSTRKQMNLIK